MSPSSKIAAALASALVLLYVAPAGAQPSATDKALAESLFQDAKRLMKAGKAAEACPKLAESNRIVPKLGTLLNLATCHAEEGKTASAWAEFTQAENLANASKQGERARYAHDQAKELEKRLSHLVIEAPGADKDLEVKLDGTAVGGGVLGSALSIDPGSHEITAAAPGKRVWNTTVKVEPGAATVRVSIPVLEKEAALPVTAPPASPPPPATPPPAPENSGTAQRIAGIAVMVAGAAGVGVGIGFGLKTFSQEGDSNSHCHGTQCDQTGVDLRAGAHTSATISTATFIAGGVLIAGGLVVILTAPSKKAAPSALWVAPAVAGGSPSLSVGGVW